MYYIYSIFNKRNGKHYIGKTNDIKERWRKHVKIAYTLNYPKRYYIHRAIFKYGKEAFEFSILQEYEDEKTAYNAEEYWVDYFNSTDSKFGYNLTKGGIAPIGIKRKPVSEETKYKISKTLKKIHEKDLSLRIRCSKQNIGRQPSKKTIEKRNQSMSIKKENGWINPNIGRKLPEETKIKVIKGSNLARQKRKELGIENKMKGVTNLKNSGEGCGTSKLTEKEVLDIRNKFHNNNYKDLANEYNISLANIYHIIKRKTWKHI